MATDTEICKGVAIGIASSAIAANATATNPINVQQANTNAIAEIQKQRRSVVVFQKAAADGMASTTTAETTTFQSTTAKCRVYKICFTPTGAGITADNSNFATITVSARPAAGGASTSIGTLTTTITSSGTLVQDVRANFVLGGTVDLVDGQEFTFAIAKSGTGVVVPVGFFTIFAEDT